jgi:Arylsulfotransferase (ASST)
MIFSAQLKHFRRLIALVGTGVVVLTPVAAAETGQPPANPNAAYTTQGAWTFISSPNLHPPKLHTDQPTQSKKLDPGYFFLGAFKNLTQTQPMNGQAGPLLLDNHLQPVWFRPDCVSGCGSQDIWTQNLGEQTYKRQPVLTWWQGALSPVGVTESGTDYVVNEHYRTVATLHGADGWIIDSHELIITGNNAWASVTKNVPVDLTAYGGSAHGSVIDTAVQKYDLRTGALLDTWDPLSHVPLSDSYTRPNPSGAPWDAYHLNSIQVGSGTFLAGFRNTWSAYMVNAATQATQWILGGKRSSYVFGPGAAFSWQHNVLLHPGNIVSVFDDACCAITGVKNGTAQFGPPNGPARGLVLKLSPTTHTASVVAQYTRGPKFEVAFTGSTQLLPSSNVVVGWGSTPYFTEYSKAGKVLLDAVWPKIDLSYRAELVQNWVGTPFFAPAGAVRVRRGKPTVYASWNGATQVARWQVLAGHDAKHLSLVASKGRSGFETAIRLKRGYKLYKVRALDAKGHVLRTSPSFPRHITTTTTSPGFY